MARRLVVLMALLPLVLSACNEGRSSSASGRPSPSVSAERTTAPKPSPTSSASTRDVDLVERRDRLHGQLLARNVEATFLGDDAGTLRGHSVIDGISLDELLTALASDFILSPDDDVYTARVTTLGMGRPMGDGSKIDPKYEDIHAWVIRRHHVMQFSHYGKIPMPGHPTPQPCAFFNDYAYVFVPSARPRELFALNLRQESETGTEAAEAKAAGAALCQSGM